MNMLTINISENFSDAVKIITHEQHDEPMGSLPGIHMRVYSRALIMALKIMRSNTFPEKEVYASC